MTNNRRVGLQLSDLHGGAQHGAVASNTQYEGKTLGMSAVQLRIEKLLFRIIERVNEFASGDPVDLHITGDVGNGNTHMTQEALYTPDPHGQAAIVSEFLGYLRLIDTLDTTTLVYGTKAHDWAQNAVTKQVAEMLVTKGFKDVDYGPHFAAWYDDIFVNSAHHGPRINETTIRNYLDNVAPGREGMIQVCVQENRQIPHLVLRGHWHLGYKYVYRYKVLGEWRNIIYLAGYPMCGINDYARQKTNQTERFTCGAWMWEQIGDHIPTDTIEDITEVFDTRDIIYRGSARPDGRGCLAHVRKNAGAYSANDGQMRE